MRYLELENVFETTEWILGRFLFEDYLVSIKKKQWLRINRIIKSLILLVVMGRRLIK
ncbi:MAG: hypothetical protein GX759_02650 [Thermoanaerobacterales bacterium]|nr:hypothetical protein [Thermoanaerobacterales bacterium]